jgi:triphosphoribosyl-dephospho-CoA synthase
MSQLALASLDAAPRAGAAFCAAAARLAVRSLYIELALYPKPGLVSLVDNGSHDDMDAGTFMRSLFALRHYFVCITRAGMDGAPFAVLRELGIAAERRMLQATAGVNTHRGAIFCLGMLCAAAGLRHARGLALSPSGVRQTLLAQWGGAVAVHHGGAGGRSHGQRVAALHAVGGARAEMARGLPSVFEVALPTLKGTLAAGRGQRAARVDALFALMAHLGDTNVYHRAGAAGALLVRQSAQAFLDHGGTGRAGWERMALDCHRRFVAHRLSPGGAADLLAATCFVQQLDGMTRT